MTNFTTRAVTLQKVEATTGDAPARVLLSLTDSVLMRNVARPGSSGSIPSADRVRLPPGVRAVVYLWVTVARDAPPASLRNRVTLLQGEGDSSQVRELVGPSVPVTPEAAALGPPLRGGVWLAANGPANQSGHRRALIPIDGTPAIAQRFAIDYVKVGGDHRTFDGDREQNRSYYAQGMEAIAVADGVVAATKDGIPENVPGPTSRAVPITLETVGGNHVILDIGGGRYAFYAHLQPGSLLVRAGDRVRRGQVIGLVGNSGNSTEPHLHFHLADGMSPLGSEGIPYRYETFELVGHCRTIGLGCERGEPQVRRGEIPLANALLRFP